MKTTFIYGAGIAVASFVVGLILFFAGYHTDIEKLSAGQTIGSVVSIIITIIGFVMVLRVRRDETPAEEAFGYGKALGTTTLTALWSAILGAILTFVYATVINPAMKDTMLEAQIMKMEEQGVPPEGIEQAEGIMEFMMSPAMMSVSNLIAGFFFGFIIALIVSIFVRRPAAEAAVPPPAPTEG